VDDATVTFSGMSDSIKTNQEGVAQASFSVGSGQPHYELQVSKPGYLTSEHVLFQSGANYFREDIFDGAGASGVFTPPPPVRVKLDRVPGTPAERAAVEAEERRRRFLLAVKRRDVAGLRRLLEAGASADTADPAGVPAIAWAAFVGEAEAIKLLLDAGAGVRRGAGLARKALQVYLSSGISHDKRSGQATYEQVVARREGVVRRLLAAGATVNSDVLVAAIAQTPHLGQPPHSLTIETVRLLLAAGADVNPPPAGGTTPLMEAASRNSPAVLKLLLDAGAHASLNAKDGLGRTALMLAPGSRSDPSSTAAARLLVAAGADVNAADREGQTPLMLNALKQVPEMIALLLKAGANVNAKDSRGRTALLYVRQEMYADVSAQVIAALIAAGAEVNVSDEEGRTPLMYAAGNAEATNSLLKAGARATINARDKKGRTALMHAAYVETLRPLLEAGAEIGAKDDLGRNALMYAAFEHSAPQAVAFLLASGAKADESDAEGQTALMLAATTERGGATALVIQALLEGGARPTLDAKDGQGRTALMRAAETGAAETVGALLAAGASVNARDGRGRTALMYAKPRSRYASVADVVKVLVGARADVNAADEEGQTPLMFAVKGGSAQSEEVIKTLLAAGASLNARDRLGRTALMLAARMPLSHYDSLKVLLDAGADVNAADQEGRTALMEAAASAGIKELYEEYNVKVLLGAGAKPDLADKRGRTALAIAKEMLDRGVGNLAVISLLEEAARRR
jgi:ankyrin repeat protein